MKKLKMYFAFLVLVLGSSIQCIAAQNFKKCCEQPSQSANYYVSAGGVYVAADRIFVLFEGELVEVNMLCSDAKGIFVPESEMNRRFVWCSICQRWYDPDQPHNCK